MNSARLAISNDQLALADDILGLAKRPDLPELLRQLDVDWKRRTTSPSSLVYDVFEKRGFVQDGALTREGLLFYSRLTLPFDEIDPEAPSRAVKGTYRLVRAISIGKNSAIFEAEHSILQTKAVVKLLRPGASQDIVRSLRLLASGERSSSIVAPSDFFRATVKDVFNNDVEVDCIVFPFVSGTTFADFLRQGSTYLNSHIVVSFMDQVGRALLTLERLGAYHGDLHDRNILVDYDPNRGIEFRLVDISFDAMGSLGFEVCRNNDLTSFKTHIWRLLSAQKSAIRKLSIRKYLGTRVFQKIDRVLSRDTRSFAAVVEALEDESTYASFLAAKDRFVSERFGQPVSFRLQRYEEITDPAIAAKLFVPFPELMASVREFGNMFVSGNRGSGKSTYLAALSFSASIDEPVVPFAEVFGVYFPCRQGEFMTLVPVDGRDPRESRSRTSHVLAVKIIRRTLESIAAGVAGKVLQPPADTALLTAYLNRFLPPPGIVRVERTILSDIDNLVASLVRLELEEVANFSRERSFEVLLRPRDLQEFFDLVRRTFSALSTTQFHVLFDDAGDPYTPLAVQWAINDLMLASNPIYCVKISAEKLTFAFVSADGKALENGHDYVVYDISSTLYIGAQAAGGLKRERLERYFRQIVDSRLAYFNYRSHDIIQYLGDDLNVAQKLISLLAAGRKDAYYWGWTAVWNIADRTPRNLLELVSEIFSVAGVERDTEPTRIPLVDQDRAIRTISEKRLQSLSQISGAIDIGGKRESLGRRLFEITATIGSTFRIYLRDERGLGHKRQHLALERNDSDQLSPEAALLLDKLVTFGILDDSKSAFARDDRNKKPVFVLNRIFCPAFQISFVRDEHLRLSRHKFEMLLLEPAVFSRQGTRRLRDDVAEGRPRDDLFGYDIYE